MADDDMIVLTADEYRRVGRAVRDFETHPRVIPAPGLRRPLPIKSPGDPVLWIDCENNTSPGEAIPPRSAVEIIGGELDADGETIVLQVKKPSADNLPIHKVGITDENEIPDLLDDGVTRGRGFLTFEPTWSAYDDAGTDSDQIGTVTDSFLLTNDQTGFWKYLRRLVSGADVRAYVQRMTEAVPGQWNWVTLTKVTHTAIDATSYTKIDFTATGTGTGDLVADASTDEITITHDGYYLIEFKCSVYADGSVASGDADCLVRCFMHTNGTRDNFAGMEATCLVLNTAAIRQLTCIAWHKTMPLNDGDVLDIRVQGVGVGFSANANRVQLGNAVFSVIELNAGS